MSKFTVAIAGGGIAGLALAGALSKYESIEVDVYEASKNFEEVGVGLTLWGRVWEILYHMGLAEDCIKASVANASSTGHSTASRGFRLRGFKDPDQDFGVLPMKDGRSLHRADLLRILLSRVPRSNTHLEKKLIGYIDNASSGGIILHFADGTTATCDVLVGCDGIRSNTRTQMMQNEAERSGNRNYTQYIQPRWSGNLAHRFLIPSASLAARNPNHSLLSGPQVYFGKGMHVVGYPISPTMLNAAVSITDLSKEGTMWPRESWSTKRDRKENADRLRPLFAHWHSEAREIVETIDSTIEWAIHDLEPLPFYTRGRVVLVGDAAHASLPYVGSGAAYAFEDIFVLARLLGAVITTRESLPLALQVYQDIRRPCGNKLILNVRRALRAFQYNGPEGDDMRKVQRTIREVFEECGGIGDSGPEAEANKAIAWLKRRISETS